MTVLNRLASSMDRRDEVPNQFPYLLQHLSSCCPKEVPQHAEKALPAGNSSNRADFIKVLEKRMEDLSGSGLARVKKVIEQATNS